MDVLGRAALVKAHKFTAASFGVRITTGAVTETLNFIPVANRDYFATGQSEVNNTDDTFGNGDYLLLLLNMLNTNTGGGTYTLVLSEEGFLTISCDLAFQIIWSDVLTTLDAELFGFLNTTAAPIPAGITAVSLNAVKTWWYPDQDFFRTNWADPMIIGSADRTIDQTVFGYSLNSPTNQPRMFRMIWAFNNQSRIRTQFAITPNLFNTLERVFLEGLASFCRFRIYQQSNLRDLTTDQFWILRLIDNGTPWNVEEEQRLTSYAATIRAFETE